jgi:hypothetical protein
MWAEALGRGPYQMSSKQSPWCLFHHTARSPIVRDFSLIRGKLLVNHSGRDLHQELAMDPARRKSDIARQPACIRRRSQLHAGGFLGSNIKSAKGTTDADGMCNIKISSIPMNAVFTWAFTVCRSQRKSRMERGRFLPDTIPERSTVSRFLRTVQRRIT